LPLEGGDSLGDFLRTILKLPELLFVCFILVSEGLQLSVDGIAFLVIVPHVVGEGLGHLVAIHGPISLKLVLGDLGNDLSTANPVNLLEGPVLPGDILVGLGREGRTDLAEGQAGHENESGLHEIELLLHRFGVRFLAS
jgi:hypothetical protein